jgi:curved DNA-binding protein CbpA
MIQHEKTNRAFELAKKENLYERLGVSSNATSEEITKAYRQLALLLHPDRNQNRQDEARKAFSRINEANETLKDPARRGEYDRYHAKTSQPQGSWSEGAQVDPQHRDRHRSEQGRGSQAPNQSRHDLDKQIRDVYLRALDIFSIKPSKEDVLRFLSTPPERHETPDTLHFVLKAAVGLKLITPNDVLKTPAIVRNLKEALATFAGYKGSEALNLEKTLRQKGMWSDEVFQKKDIAEARALHAQHLLAKLIRDHFQDGTTVGVSILSIRFTSLQNDLVSSGWISRDAACASTVVEEAMSSLATGFDKMVAWRDLTSSVTLLTQELQHFLQESGLTLPEGCKKALTEIYANRIAKQLEKLKDQGWGVEYELKQLVELVQATEPLGLSVRDELERRRNNSPRTPTHA